MSKVITDENQLNTEVDDLITEDYALEVLGLKNPADFRKFSRSFMKLSKIVKGIENVSNKVASKTELGRVKIGDNLTITEDGVLSGNPEYTHPVGAGYKHIPAGGTTGQVLKNNGDGSAEWGNLSLENYYTKPEIDTKFKNLNLVPTPIGGILFMGNNTNPAEIYPSTTWELLPDNKFLKTGSTPLQQAGSNNISISKANLPTDKLQIDSFQLGRGTQEITGAHQSGTDSVIPEGAFYMPSPDRVEYGQGAYRNSYRVAFQASRSWTGMSTSASPYTTNMGNGTPISINPEHITVKAWKRLT